MGLLKLQGPEGVNISIPGKVCKLYDITRECQGALGFLISVKF